MSMVRDALDRAARKLHRQGGIRSLHVYAGDMEYVRHDFETCPDPGCVEAAAALRATDVPSDVKTDSAALDGPNSCLPMPSDRWRCVTHDGYFGGRTSGGRVCSVAALRSTDVPSLDALFWLISIERNGNGVTTEYSAAGETPSEAVCNLAAALRATDVPSEHDVTSGVRDALADSLRARENAGWFIDTGPDAGLTYEEQADRILAHPAMVAALRATDVPSDGLRLDEHEQAAMDDLLRFMGRLDAMGLRANQTEMVAAVHVLQGFVVQHMLQRLGPESWGQWFTPAPSGDEPCTERRDGLRTKADEVIAGHSRNLNGCRECGQLWPCHAVLLAWDIRRAATSEDPRADTAHQAPGDPQEG